MGSAGGKVGHLVFLSQSIVKFPWTNYLELYNSTILHSTYIPDLHFIIGKLISHMGLGY
jgi:hypothetical protein